MTNCAARWAIGLVAGGAAALGGGVAAAQSMAWPPAAGGAWALLTDTRTADADLDSLSTRLRARDWRLAAMGPALGLRQQLQVEVRQFDAAGLAPAVQAPSAAVVLPRGEMVGLKLQLAGDGVTGPGRWLPQMALGLQIRQTQPALGLDRSALETDVRLDASRLFAEQGWLVQGSLRYASQSGALAGGLPGLGGAAYSLRPELSVAYLVARNLAVGAEYRFKPTYLETAGRAAGLADSLRDEDSADLFVAWAPYKNLSLTLAYVGLGRTVPGIVPYRRPNGAYVSAQFAF